MMKNAFYFILKAYLVLKIFKFLSRLFSYDFFAYRNIIKFCRSIHFGLVTLILNKLATTNYSPCFKKQTIELLLHLFIF